MPVLVRCLVLVALFMGGGVLAHAEPFTKPGGMRLGDAVKPLAYDAELTLIPTQDKFSGKITIDIDVAAPTKLIWINADHLELRHVVLTSGGRVYPGRAQNAPHDFSALRFASTVPAGRATLMIEYDGLIEKLDTSGIFKLKDGDEWYLYTQFEDIAARHAFPCFDEPGWKTPWKLALDVRASDVAVSNGAALSEELIGNGLKRVRFNVTPPLPTYLIAFGVGPFDIVDGGRAGRKNTPLRYIVPRGHAAETHFAAQATPRILETLEDYFGQPYPFEKLDSMAIPVTVGFGAMENAGLITYESRELLTKPDAENEASRRLYVENAAHEIAHHWFGDDVTPQWWDDIWLNEAMASWIGQKTADRFNPAWQIKLNHDVDRPPAVNLDRLASTRQIHQPVTTTDDLANAFDSISYLKGAAVLSMVEHWMGEERFRNGIRHYLNDHAYGTVRTDDLIGALTAEGGPEFAAVGPIVKSYIDQPGIPRLDVALDCGPDSRAPPKLDLTQSRFVPSARTPELRERFAAQKWTLPICFQYGNGADYGDFCTVLKEPKTVVPLPDGERCPAWVVANPGGSSYLLPVLSPSLTQTLSQAPLLPDEALPVLHDVALLTQTGDFPVDTALGVATRFGNNRQSLVVQEAIPIVQAISPEWFTNNGDRVAMGRFVRRSFGARAKLLGWLPKPGERDADADLRRELLPFVAIVGDDESLKHEADRLARDWLAGRQTLGSMTAPILRTAAHEGTHDLLDGYLAALEKTNSPAERSALFQGIGSFRDARVSDDAMAVVLNEHFDARESINILSRMATDPLAVGDVIQFLHAHYDAIVKRLPEYSVGSFARYGRTICEGGLRREFVYYFGDHISKISGGPRNLAQTLEKIDICIAARDTQAARLHTFLQTVPE